MIYHEVLETEQIRLRAIEPEDIEVLYDWENNTDIWLMSSTIAPISKDVLRKYIENNQYDIYAIRQLRLMIDAKDLDFETVGAIDLYDFDPNNRRAGVGVFVAPKYSKNGYAAKALGCIKNYTRDVLFLRQIYAEISQSNTPSLSLFKNAGFVISGEKIDWIRTPEGFENQYVLQFLFL